MKHKITLVLSFITLLSFSSTLKAQEKQEAPEKFRIIAGARVNPLVIFKPDGTKFETTRLHFEVGALIHKKFYTSVGYTPFVNSMYLYNEYWFIGLDKKLPVSWQFGGEYMFDDNRAILQSGPNFKLGKIGNAFVFAFAPTSDLSKVGVKLGVFIPLNVLLMKR